MTTKYLIGLYILASLSLIFTSCNKEEYLSGEYNCVFEQIDENRDGELDDNERAIIDECRENALTSKAEIENNLIGEWRLVGYASGWLATPSQPCSRVIFSEEELTLEYSSGIDTITTHLWEIEEITIAGNQGFRLNTNPRLIDLLNPLAIGKFCNNYMYSGAAASVDSDSFIYQKVKE